METKKKAASDSESCATCKYFLVHHPKDNGGYCRRFPATVLVLSDGEFASVLPVAAQDGYCGEFKQRLQG